MSDLFKRTEVAFGGSMAADKGLIVPNKGLTGILMQNLNLTYSQNVSRIYELGKFGEKISMYLIGGRSQGQMGAAHVIGPRVTMKQFYDNFSDVCEAGTNDIKILVQAQCDTAVSNRLAYNAKYCVLVQVGMAVGAADFVINENSALMFSNLEYDETNAQAQQAAANAAVANVAGALSNIAANSGLGAIANTVRNAAGLLGF